MNIVAPLTALLLLSMQADNAALLTRLKTLDNAAAATGGGCRNHCHSRDPRSTGRAGRRFGPLRPSAARAASSGVRPRGADARSSTGLAFWPRYRRPDVCQALRSAQTAPRRHSVAQRPPVPRSLETADCRAGRGTNPRRQVAAGHYPRESGIRSSGARSRPGGPGPIGAGRRDCEHAG